MCIVCAQSIKLMQEDHIIDRAIEVAYKNKAIETLIAKAMKGHEDDPAREAIILLTLLSIVQSSHTGKIVPQPEPDSITQIIEDIPKDEIFHAFKTHVKEGKVS